MKRPRLRSALSVSFTDRDELARLCAIDVFEEGDLQLRVWAAIYLGISNVKIKDGELEPGSRGFETSYPNNDQREVAKLEPGQAIGPAERDRICPRITCPVRHGHVGTEPADLGPGAHPELLDSLRAWLDEQVDEEARA